jgi:nucleoside-diphosphate-sugar epimerase
MKVLVTGHNGYIGTVLVPLLQQAGHEVHGLDTYFYDQCCIYGFTPDIPSLRLDVRDVQGRDLEGFEAVIHLAALSNDPLGDLDPELTYEINYRASVRLAKLAKDAGVARFLFSSSCSLYGAADGDDFLTEDAPFNPVTPYGESKIRTEEELSKLASLHFSPVYLRNSTAYGLSDRLRTDLVVTNLTGFAYLTGQALIKSDGMAWRPLVHVEDISRAFIAALEAPQALVHDQAFNVGRTSENYRVRDVAELVREVVTGCKVVYEGGAGADTRNYRVACDKIERTLPSYKPTWTVKRGIEQVYQAFCSHRLTEADFLGPRYQRLKRIRQLIDSGQLDSVLRWRPAAVVQPEPAPVETPPASKPSKRRRGFARVLTVTS